MSIARCRTASSTRQGLNLDELCIPLASNRFSNSLYSLDLMNIKNKKMARYSQCFYPSQ